MAAAQKAAIEVLIEEPEHVSKLWENTDYFRNELDSMGLLFLREGNSIKAFANRCTHASYDLRPFDDSGLSTCIGHGAQFNTDGEAVTGPATRSLKSFETLLNENELTVFGG